MFPLLLGFIAYVPAIIVSVIYGTPAYMPEGPEVLFYFSLVVGTIFTGANLIVNFCELHEQIKDIESIEEYSERRKVFVRLRDELLTQAVLYLGEKYPEHEKEIFKLISEKNNEAAVTLITAIPELKSMEALKELVGKLQKYHGKVCDQDLAILRCKRDIRVRKRNPWLIQPIIPSHNDEE